MTTRITPDQRHTRRAPCPVCGGGDDDPRGRGVRCHGFTSSDGRYAHCSREEHAGTLASDGNGRTYPHRLDGSCRCGAPHQAQRAQPNERPQLSLLRQAAKAMPPRRYVDIPDALTIGETTYTCSAIYPYPTAAGEPRAFEVRRYDTAGSPPGAPGHDKTYRPFSRRPEDGLWVMTRLEGWPLYHLPQLRAAPADAPVLIVEGEKCANAAQAALQAAGLAWAVTTTPGGEGQVRQLPKVMFEPLAGRDVVILPDHDAAGERYAAIIAKHARAAGAARVVALCLDGLAGKGDVADWLAQRQSGQAGQNGD